MDIPVLLFTGFLDAGKTSYIRQMLADPEFFAANSGHVLMLLCEEGEAELDSSEFASKSIDIEVIDSERKLNPDKLAALLKKHRASQVVIEYNGMWLLRSLFQALPDGWFIEREILFMDSSTIEVFNANMRNLVVDKLTTCDIAIFNRCDDDTDIQTLHKLVRAINRRTNIVYEKTDKTSFFDEIEDPLPFDINAPVIKIEDRDYAIFYSDLVENLKNYDGKTVSFLGQTGTNSRVPKGGFVIGRPIMTCCAEDTQFSGLYCENGADKIYPEGWAVLTAKITVKKSNVYGQVGPVLSLVSITPAKAPDEPVATFY